jgi:protein associated with RNAse G/E
VVYTKYDGSLHWHYTMRYLGTDEHGVWLGAPAGLPMRRGSEPPVSWDHAFTMLIPRNGSWWTAAFNVAPHRIEVYCDIASPPHWIGDDEVTMVDLDLDVVRYRADGRVVLLDEDEFAEHRLRYAYPAEVISQAQHAAGWLREAITSGREPFDAAYRSWLAEVT